jgi:hypothetical protein
MLCKHRFGLGQKIYSTRRRISIGVLHKIGENYMIIKLGEQHA